MILTKYDIEQLRKKLIAQQRDIPVITGIPTQYYFAYDTEDGGGGICGMEVVILDVRHGEDPTSKMFHADIAIKSNIVDFYVDYLNIPVISLLLVDAAGKKVDAICRFSDVEIVANTMNAKFRAEEKPSLKLVVDNSNAKDSSCQ